MFSRMSLFDAYIQPASQENDWNGNAGTAQVPLVGSYRSYNAPYTDGGRALKEQRTWRRISTEKIFLSSQAVHVKLHEQ